MPVALQVPEHSYRLGDSYLHMIDIIVWGWNLMKYNKSGIGIIINY